MSGLPWVFPSVFYNIEPTKTLYLDQTYHIEPKTHIGIQVLQSTTDINISYNINEQWIENIIDRPKMFSDLVISYSTMYSDLTLGWTLTSSYQKPAQLVIIFDIIPIEDTF